jgi:hypothetical protein
MVLAARDNKPETGIFGWPLSPLVRSVGLILSRSCSGRSCTSSIA